MFSFCETIFTLIRLHSIQRSAKTLKLLYFHVIFIETVDQSSSNFLKFVFVQVELFLGKELYDLIFFTLFAAHKNPCGVVGYSAALFSHI